ncbi:MAG: ABC transporter permease [Planctomycetes bacterium]|nr:ABC transporter permease [Planctomycetota bacterium]
MSLTYFVVSRNWASSWLRIALTLSGIALGVAIVVAIYVMDFNTIQSRLVQQDPQRGRVDLEVLPVAQSQPTAEVLADLRRRDGVADVAVWREARGVLQVAAPADARPPLDVAVFGLGPVPAGTFAHYVVARGRDLEAADAEPGSYGVLLGGAAAQQLGVDVGAKLTLREPPPQQRVECVDGKLVPVPLPPGGERFAADVTVVGVLAPERLGKRNFELMAVVAFDLSGSLRAVGQSLFHVLREPGADLDRLKQELGQGYTVQDARGALIGEGADERAFRNGLKVLGGLALLLGMYVVFQTLSHSLMARIRQLGLLRCLGAGTGAITRIFLLDALLLGVLGSVLGVGLGLLLALFLQRENVSSLGLGKQWSTFEVPWFPVLWTAGLGVLFTLAGAMFPLVRARQVPALDILRARGLAPGNDDGVDLMRGVHTWMLGLLVVALPLAYLAMTPLAVEEGQETRAVLLELAGMLGLFGGVLLLAPGITTLLGRALLLPFRPLMPLATWLVAKVLKRSAGRVAASVCGLSAVLLAVLGLKSVTASLTADVREFSRAAMDDRAFLMVESKTRDEVAALATLPGVTGVDAFEGTVMSGGFLLRGLDVAAAAGRDGPLEREGALVHRYTDDRARTLIASRRLAKARGWKPGELVAMRDKNGVPVSYEVLAISDRAGFDSDERAFAIASPHWLRRDFCITDRCVENLTLHLEPGTDPDRVIGQAREALGGLIRGKSGDWVRGYLLRDVGRDFRIFDALLFLMLVLAGVGLLNGMTIAALGRARELGVLRALGMSRGALGGSFLVEGAVVAGLASALSLGLAFLLAQVLVFGMNVVARLDAPVQLPWRWFGYVPVLALGTALVASLLPAWRALRQSPSESVRYE